VPCIQERLELRYPEPSAVMARVALPDVGIDPEAVSWPRVVIDQGAKSLRSWRLSSPKHFTEPSESPVVKPWTASQRVVNMVSQSG
jgi:hypothetical protein